MASHSRRGFQSHDSEIDRIVDNSYGFLSDMHGGDTLPRGRNGPPVQVVSWNDRNSQYSTPSRSAKGRYLEPRFKSVRDIPQEQLPPPRRPRQRYEEELQHRNYTPPKVKFTQQPSQENYPKNISRENSHYGVPTNVGSKYVPPPKAPSNWEKPFKSESNLLAYTNNAVRKPETVPARWDTPIMRKSSMSSEPINDIDHQNGKGSYLLQRTNHYLDAVGRMRSIDQDVGDSLPKSIVDQTRSHTTYAPTPPRNEDHVSDKRKSIAERIQDLNQSSVPPPPPLPPPVPNAMSNHEKSRPPLSYISQIKTGRDTLRPINRIMNRPEQSDQPEPQNFKDRLNRLLKFHMDQRNMPQSPVLEDQEENDGTGKYNTVKTLSKAAMKDKLEVIFQAPPKNPSFRGANDLAEHRQSRQRFNESRMANGVEKRISRQSSGNSFVRPQPSNAADLTLNRDVCHECGNHRGQTSSHDVTERQKVLMENVFATIKLKGRTIDDSHL